MRDLFETTNQLIQRGAYYAVKYTGFSVLICRTSQLQNHLFNLSNRLKHFKFPAKSWCQTHQIGISGAIPTHYIHQNIQKNLSQLQLMSAPFSLSTRESIFSPSHQKSTTRLTQSPLLASIEVNNLPSQIAQSTPNKLKKNELMIELAAFHQHYHEIQINKQQKIDVIDFAECLKQLDENRMRLKRRGRFEKITQALYGKAKRERKAFESNLLTRVMQNITHQKELGFRDFRQSIAKGAKHLFLSNIGGAIGRRAGLLLAACSAFAAGSAQTLLTVGILSAAIFAFLQRFMYSNMHARDFARSDINSPHGNLNMEMVCNPSNQYTPDFRQHPEYLIQSQDALATLLGKSVDELNQQDSSHLQGADDVFLAHQKFKKAQQYMQKNLQKIQENKSFKNEWIVRHFLNLSANLKKAEHRYQAEYASLKSAFRLLYATGGIRLILASINAIAIACAPKTFGKSLIIPFITAGIGGILAVVELFGMYAKFANDYGCMSKVNLLNCLKHEGFLHTNKSRDDFLKTHEYFMNRKKSLAVDDLGKLKQLEQEHQKTLSAYLNPEKIQALWTRNADYRIDKASDYINYRIEKYQQKIKVQTDKIDSFNKRSIYSYNWQEKHNEILKKEDFEKKLNAWRKEQHLLTCFKTEKDISKLKPSCGFTQKQTLQILLNKQEAAGLVAEATRAKNGKAFQRSLEVFASTIPALSGFAALDMMSLTTHPDANQKIMINGAAFMDVVYYQAAIAGGFSGGYQTVPPQKELKSWFQFKQFSLAVFRGAIRPFKHLNVAYDLEASRMLRQQARSLI